MPALTVALVLLFTTFLSSPSAFADVAKIGDDGRADFLYRTGAFVIRTECPESSAIRRRTTCTLQPHRLEAVLLYDFVLGRLRRELPGIDRTMGETQANLTETDAKLGEFLRSDVQTPANQQELEVIRLAEVDAAEHTTAVEGLKEQIVRIRSSPDYRTNPDLPLQLATLERQLAEEAKARDEKIAAVNALRTAYVAAHSTGHSQAAFQLLVRQQKLQAAQYESLRGRSEQILEQLLRMNQFIGEIIEDQSFAYEIDDQAPFADEVQQVFRLFAEAQKEAGVIQGTMGPDGVTLSIPHRFSSGPTGSIDYDARVRWLQCSFRIWDPWLTRCSGISAMAPNNSGANRSQVWELPALAFDITSEVPPAGFQDFQSSLMRNDASGRWRFLPICNRTVIDRRDIAGGSCELRFDYEDPNE